MTVRLLCAYSQYPANAIVTLDAGTEAGLVAAKAASANLTGGDAYVPPATQTQLYPVLAAVDGGGAVTLVDQRGAPIPVAGSSVLPAASSTNRGGTVASANVSQVLMPANAARAGIVFQNNSPWPIGLNLTGGVAACGSGSVSAPGAGIGSLFIAPGRTFTSDALAVSASQITVACQRGTAAFGCTEYTAASGQAFAKTVADRSGTITYGGVSQALFAANTSRKGFIFQNLSKFPMFVQEVVLGALTGSSRKVLPYEILGANDFGVSTSAFSVICRGAGNGFTALEY